MASRSELIATLRSAEPGTTIAIAPGTYRGGITVEGPRGTAGRPIVLRAADPDEPPVLYEGSVALHLRRPEHVVLDGLVIEGASGNGLNIDDGGDPDRPAHHVTLRNLTVRKIGPRGNRDGIKLSGVDHFLIKDCDFEQWGDFGSGIDMVGCHDGTIRGCRFRFRDDVGANGVQIKGGSHDIRVTRCRFEHAGSRAINAGGSTGMPYFRPQPPPEYEAKDVLVEDCTFLGGQCAVAFVGVDGAVVRHNTIFRPTRWVFRILQETTEPGFVPSRDGEVRRNLIVYRGDELSVPINIGPRTAPETFTLTENAWYRLDDPGRPPRLPGTIPQHDGVRGIAPSFVDLDSGDLRQSEDSSTAAYGFREAGR